MQAGVLPTTDEQILHYRVLSSVGEGGMGHVYKAQDLTLNRIVALKILNLQDEEMLDTQDERPGVDRRRRTHTMLLKEARLASALNHPNIVTIHAIEESDSFDFIVMEYLEGETLWDRLRRGRMPLGQVLPLIVQAADALAAAHAAGIIHRDIKPSNIHIGPHDQVKVLDFGLAVPTGFTDGPEAGAPAGREPEGTRVRGTVPYMSPEQARGEPLDPRTDLFSLGSVLFHATTGRLPFRGRTSPAILENVKHADVPMPSAVRPDLPAAFDELIGRAMAKDRAQRFASATEMAAALRNLVELTQEQLPEVRVPQASAPLVGREAEIERLSRRLSQAKAGAGGLVLLAGEPGIGKTALTEELLRRVPVLVPGALFCHGRCVEQYGPGEAYLPFLDALAPLLSGSGKLVQALRTHAPTWCLNFPATFGSPSQLAELQREAMGASKERMLREMGDALGALTMRAPLLMVLEDLHWADPSSIDLLRHLARRARSHRLLMIGTYRPDAVELTGHPLKAATLELIGHGLCEEVLLAPLREADLRRYIATTLPGAPFADELAAFVQRKTEGHALFAVSQIQFLVQTGVIAREEDGHFRLTRPLAESDMELPESVRAMIGKKIETLGDSDRRALKFASTDVEFLSTVTAKLLGVDELDLEEQLDRLARVHRVIDRLGEEELPDGKLATRYRFAHALYKDVLYGDLAAQRRAQLHRQVGEELLAHYGKAAATIAPLLALHFERGREFARAIDFLVEAGDAAKRVYASGEAERHYTRALGLVDKLPPEEQRARLHTLSRRLGDFYVSVSRFTEAADELRRSVGHARALGDAKLEAGALVALANALFFCDRMDEAMTAVDEALDAARRAGDERLHLEALVVRGMKQICHGELDDARPLWNEIAESAGRLSHKPALLAVNWLAQIHALQTEYGRAEVILKESIVLAEEMRVPFERSGCLFHLVMVVANQGRMTEAIAMALEGLSLAERAGNRFWESRFCNCLGWIYNELEDPAHAVEWLERSLKVARAINNHGGLVNVLMLLGGVYRKLGDPARGMACLDEAGQLIRSNSWYHWSCEIRRQAGVATHHLATGDVEGARDAATRLLESATRFGRRKYAASAHRLLALAAMQAGDLDTAARALDAAVDILDRWPAPLQAWKTWAAVGELRTRWGDPEGARAAYHRSAALLRAIAASVTDEAVRACFLSAPPVRAVLEAASRP